MGWVGGVVLSKRLVRSIAGSLKVALERLEHIVAAPYFFALRRHRRFDCSRFEHAQKLFFDRIVYAKAAERDATRLAAVEPAAPAGIARDVVIAARR